MERYRTRSSRRSSSIREKAGRMGNGADLQEKPKTEPKRFVSPRELIQNARHNTRLRPRSESEYMRLPSRLPSGKPSFIHKHPEMSFVSEISSNSSSEDESLLSSDEEMEVEEKESERAEDENDQQMENKSGVSTIDTSTRETPKRSVRSIERHRSKGSKTVSEFASILADMVPRAPSASFDEYSISGMTAKIYDGHFTHQIEELQGNISSSIENALSCSFPTSAEMGEKIVSGYEYMKSNSCGNSHLGSQKPDDSLQNEDNSSVNLPRTLAVKRQENNYHPTPSCSLNNDPGPLSRIWTSFHGVNYPNNEGSDDDRMSLMSDPLPYREDAIESLLDNVYSADKDDGNRERTSMEFGPQANGHENPGNTEVKNTDEKLDEAHTEFVELTNDEEYSKESMDRRKHDEVQESVDQGTEAMDRSVVSARRIGQTKSKEPIYKAATQVRVEGAKDQIGKPKEKSHSSPSAKDGATKAGEMLCSSPRNAYYLRRAMPIKPRKDEKNGHRSGKRWNMARLKTWKKKFFAKAEK